MLRGLVTGSTRIRGPNGLGGPHSEAEVKVLDLIVAHRFPKATCVDRLDSSVD